MLSSTNGISNHPSAPPHHAQSVIFSATQESSLLGRGEWIKFAAAFFNLDHVADAAFEQVRACLPAYLPALRTKKKKGFRSVGN